MLTRRRMLLDAGAGFGWLATSWLLQRENAQAAELGPHFAPKVKRVIQLFCIGGMSHLDTFDFKPELQKLNGKPYEMPTFFGQGGNLLASPWAFKQRGQSGLWVSVFRASIACFWLRLLRRRHPEQIFRPIPGSRCHAGPRLGRHLWCCH
jgi:hypothetical protein